MGEMTVEEACEIVRKSFKSNDAEYALWEEESQAIAVLLAATEPRTVEQVAGIQAEAAELTSKPSSEWIAGERIAASVLIRKMAAMLAAGAVKGDWK